MQIYHVLPTVSLTTKETLLHHVARSLADLHPF